MAVLFRKGDYVHYGTDGVCCVEDGPGEENQEFYVLAPVANPTSRIFVPTGNPTTLAKLRSLPTKEEIDQMIVDSQDPPLDWIADRKERAATFQAILKSSNLADMLSLVSCLYHRRNTLAAQGKKLSASDETAFRRAESLVDNELTFVLSLPREEVAGYIQDKRAACAV